MAKEVGAPLRIGLQVFIFGYSLATMTSRLTILREIASIWSGWPRHSVKPKRCVFISGNLLFRQQKTVTGPDGLALLHVIAFPDLPPASAVTEVPRGQIGETTVSDDHASLARLAGMHHKGGIKKINHGPIFIFYHKITSRHVSPFVFSFIAGSTHIRPGSAIRSMFQQNPNHISPFSWKLNIRILTPVFDLNISNLLDLICYNILLIS